MLAGTIRLTTELGHGRVERARGQLIERALAQFFIEDLNSNGAAVACHPDVLGKTGDIELASAAESRVAVSESESNILPIAPEYGVSGCDQVLGS